MRLNFFLEDLGFFLRTFLAYLPLNNALVESLLCLQLNFTPLDTVLT